MGCWKRPTTARSPSTAPTRPATAVARSPFASAIHGYVLGEIKIAQVRSWIDNTALGAIIGSIIRQTENILRKELNYRAQLRGISTPKAWEDAIRAAIVTPTPKREVEIDLAHAELIRQQSEAIRRRLIVEDEQYAPDISLEIDSSKPQINENAAAPDQPTEFAETSQKRLLHSSVIQRPTDAPDGLLTDLSAIGKLMGEPDSEQAKLLSVLRKKNWQAPPAILGEQFEHAFVNVIFDRINEAAFEVLGSALLFDEAGQWVVAEDYRDEIAYILDHPDYRSNNESSPAEAKNLFGESYRLSAELDMGWIEFAQHLQSHHWSALAILIKGIDVKSKLNAVASVTLTTANQLVDDINEVALERLSDTVIDASTEPPSVIEEYQESVDALVQWAIQNQRAETT